MSQLSVIAIVLTSVFISATSMADSQDTSVKQAQRVAEIRRQLQANDWSLIGQAFARKSIDESHFVTRSMSVFYQEENNANYEDSLNLPPGAEVNYDIMENMSLRVDLTSQTENIVIPWHLSFGDDDSIVVNNWQRDYSFGYWLEFKTGSSDTMILHLMTVTNNPGVSRIFGELQFVDDQMRLVQNIDNQQIRWDFKKAE